MKQIENGGGIGAELIGLTSSSPNGIVISRGSNGYINGNVRWNPNKTSSGLDVNGNTSRPSFIGLAHELGHAFDYKVDGYYNKLFGLDNSGPWIYESATTSRVSGAEIFAGNIENLIRNEHNIPQRAYYGIDANGAGYGSYNTNLYLIINSIHDARLY